MKKVITLFEQFQSVYPYITISKKNFIKAYIEAHTSNLDLLRDYILAKNLADDIQE